MLGKAIAEEAYEWDNNASIVQQVVKIANAMQHQRSAPKAFMEEVIDDQVENASAWNRV